MFWQLHLQLKRQDVFVESLSLQLSFRTFIYAKLEKELNFVDNFNNGLLFYENIIAQLDVQTCTYFLSPEYFGVELIFKIQHVRSAVVTLSPFM